MDFGDGCTRLLCITAVFGNDRHLSARCLTNVWTGLVATITAIVFSMLFFWLVDSLVVCLSWIRIRVPATINAILIPIMVLMMSSASRSS